MRGTKGGTGGGGEGEEEEEIVPIPPTGVVTFNLGVYGIGGGSGDDCARSRGVGVYGGTGGGVSLTLAAEVFVGTNAAADGVYVGGTGGPIETFRPTTVVDGVDDEESRETCSKFERTPEVLRLRGGRGDIDEDFEWGVELSMERG